MFIGLRNFEFLLRDGTFWAALRNNVFFALSVPFQLAIPLVLVHSLLQTKTTEIIDSLEMVSVKIVNSIAERVSYVRPPAKGAEGAAPMPHAPVPSHA